MTSKWDLRFIELARHISGWSKDPSTKVGCVVVGEDREIRSTGWLHVLAQYGASSALRLLNAIDTDKDGMVSREEW